MNPQQSNSLILFVLARVMTPEKFIHNPKIQKRIAKMRYLARFSQTLCHPDTNRRYLGNIKPFTDLMKIQ